MSNPDVINLVSSRQYKSISNIEILPKNSIMKDEFNFDYKLNLQTKDRLSSTFDIYMSIDDINNNFIEPIKELIRRRKQPLLDPITTITKNQIIPATFIYYSLNSLLHGPQHEKTKTCGCIEYLTMKFSLQDNLFIYIEAKTCYRYFLYKHRPKAIQPEKIILSLDDAEYLISTFECLHKS